MRQVQITLPEEKVGQIMEFLEEQVQIRNIAKIHTTPGFMLLFRVSDAKTQQILTDLEAQGVGVHFGIIDILPVEASKPQIEEEETISPKERLSVEEMYTKITAGARLSFDFIALLVVSTIIGAIGLAINNSVLIVASMLLAPLMGPILGLSLGTAIRDRRLVITGVLNEIYGLIIAFGIGLIMGIVLAPLSQGVPGVNNLPWPTPEMLGRGAPLGLIIGIVVAAASGAGVALAVTRGEIGSLVGVAIAASLMPPAVNTGMNLSYALIGPLIFGASPALFFSLAVISFILVVINILAINFVAILIFKLKEVAPVKRKSIFWSDLPKLDKKRREELWHR